MGANFTKASLSQSGHFFTVSQFVHRRDSCIFCDFITSKESILMRNGGWNLLDAEHSNDFLYIFPLGFQHHGSETPTEHDFLGNVLVWLFIYVEIFFLEICVYLFFYLIHVENMSKVLFFIILFSGTILWEHQGSQRSKIGNKIRTIPSLNLMVQGKI